MTYATKQNMIDRYAEQLLIELTDRVDPALNVINDTVLNGALADADALINSFIGRRYDLPLASTPPVLTQPAAAITFYTLHRGRHSDETRKAFEDAMAFLADLSSGKAVLDVGGTEPQSAPAQAVSDASDRTFTRDKLKGF